MIAREQWLQANRVMHIYVHGFECVRARMVGSPEHGGTVPAEHAHAKATTNLEVGHEAKLRKPGIACTQIRYACMWSPIGRQDQTKQANKQVYNKAEPLGGLLHQASPDPRVVRRGHSSFPPARGQQCCIRGRYRPTSGAAGSERADPENRGRLGRGVDQRL